jgi:hypothetical protein
MEDLFIELSDSAEAAELAVWLREEGATNVDVTHANGFGVADLSVIVTAGLAATASLATVWAWIRRKAGCLEGYSREPETDVIARRVE